MSGKVLISNQSKYAEGDRQDGKNKGKCVARSRRYERLRDTREGDRRGLAQSQETKI